MDEDIPIYFTAKPEMEAFAHRMMIGMVLGTLAGAALYFNDRWVTKNVLSHVNHEIVKEYHPHLLK